MTDYEQLIGQLTPEQLQTLFHGGTLHDKGDIIKDQIQQAIALRQPTGERYYGGVGGALGALGHVLNTIHGTIDEKRLRAEQQSNLADIDKLRETFGHIGQPQQQGPGMAGAQAPQMMPDQSALLQYLRRPQQDPLQAPIASEEGP